MSLISIVTTVYHTGASLPDLLVSFQGVAARSPADDFEFIFVDDGSKDDSFDVAARLAQDEPRMRVIKLSRNFGAIPAAMAGMAEARGDAVAAIASDLQDPPELIHDMLEEWRQGKKVVIAARSDRDDPYLTMIMSDAFYALFRKFAISSMPVHGFDFFLVDRQVCDLLNQIDENNAYLMGLILWLGFDRATLTYKRRQREERYGHSMWTFAKRFKYFVDSFVAFSYFPVRIVSVIGITISLVGMIYAAVIVVARLFFEYQPEGWSSLMVVLLVVSGVQMLMLGVLGEYMWRNLEETRRRPRFVIDRVIEGGARKTASRRKR